MNKVLVLLAMVLGTTNMFAFEVDGINYNITSEGDLTVEVARKEYVGDIVIPESVIYNNKKYKVTAIGERAFAGMMQLKALTIPQTITTIQQYALSELPNIESVTINCKTVERWFYENYSLKTVVLGNNVKIISDKAFFGCTKLSSLTIPNSVTSIGDMAFQDCALTSLIIPGSVRKLGDGAFAGCVKLEKVIISKGVKLIGGYAFKNCRKLGKITIPTSVTNIGLNAFELCLGLREINIPASLPKMNYNGAFDKYNRDYIHVYQNERDLLEHVEESHETRTVTDVSDKVDAMTYGNEHEAIDLGLSVYWANCNIGASSLQEYGYYFSWGEINKKNTFTESTYQYYSDGVFKNIGDDIARTNYDVAHVCWGEGWRMPTKREFEELIHKCKWIWTVYNGVKGYKVVGTNGNSIFLPAAGQIRATNYHWIGERGYYWTSTVGKSSRYAYYLVFAPFVANGVLGTESDNGHDFRYWGYLIRPVRDKVGKLP